jgi:hypothetical protein
MKTNDEIEQLLEVVDRILDISNYVYEHPKMIKVRGGISWTTPTNDLEEKKEKINNELKDKGLLLEDESVVIKFDAFGKVNKIEKILDVYDKKEIEESDFETDGFEIHIKKSDSFEIDHKKLIQYTLTENEWKNYKRTKIIDKMLNEKQI